MNYKWHFFRCGECAAGTLTLDPGGEEMEFGAMRSKELCLCPVHRTRGIAVSSWGAWEWEAALAAGRGWVLCAGMTH